MDTDLKFTLLVSEIHENVDLVLGIKKHIQVGRSKKLMELFF